jgi:hypothetical protein
MPAIAHFEFIMTQFLQGKLYDHLQRYVKRRFFVFRRICYNFVFLEKFIISFRGILLLQISNFFSKFRESPLRKILHLYNNTIT